MTADKTAFMQAAIALSFQALEKNLGGPYGAVVVKDGEIIGRGMNEVTSRQDPIAHAEILAIQEACATLGTWQLDGCEIYASGEPCPMCMSAIYWARLGQVYYGNSKEDATRYGFNSQSIYAQLALPREQRRIAMTRLMAAEAIAAFEAWAAKADKESY